MATSAPAKNMPITPETVAAAEHAHQWQQLTLKIARRGLRGLSEPEANLYEKLRKERGMTTSEEAIQEVREELGTTEEALAAVKQVEANLNGSQAISNKCLCGCGGTPKSAKARFVPGHDARYHAAEKRRADAEAKEAAAAAGA